MARKKKGDPEVPQEPQPSLPEPDTNASPVEDEAPTEEPAQKPKRQIFRTASLERLASPEQLDQLLLVISRKVWLALLVVIGLVSGLVLWSIFGSIPIKVEGKGIVMSSEGLFSVEARSSGTLSSLSVRPGDTVTKGQLIARVVDPASELKRNELNLNVEIMARDLEHLSEQITIEERAAREAMQRDLSAKEFSVKQIEQEIPQLQEQLNAKTKLYKEGLLSSNAILEAEQILTQRQISLETLRAEIAGSKANLAKGYRIEELRAKEMQVQAIKQERELLELQLEYQNVKAPSTGVVLEILHNNGELVQVGTPLVWFEYPEKEGESQIIYSYVPVELGKRIPKGASVQVDLSTVNSQEYGTLLGTVQHVSQYAVSPENIAKTIHNSGLVQFLMGGVPAVVQVVVKPDIEPKNVTGYKWTSGKGPPFKITTGTVGVVKITVERIRPLFYVFPIWQLRYVTSMRLDEAPAEHSLAGEL